MAEEEDVAAVLDEGRDSMALAIERFGKELTKIRTGRASTSILDGLTVNYFDTPTPLNQLATLSVPDPRMIVVSPPPPPLRQVRDFIDRKDDPLLGSRSVAE